MRKYHRQTTEVRVVHTPVHVDELQVVQHLVTTIAAVVANGVRELSLHTPRVIFSRENRRSAGIVNACHTAEVVSPFNCKSVTMCRAVLLAVFHYGEVQLHPDHLSLLSFHHESLSFY